MSKAQQDVMERLRAVRDEIDGLLDGEHDELDADAIRGVIFCVSDEEYAIARATQEPTTEPPAPLQRCLGELLDGLGRANGTHPIQVATGAVAMMERSKVSEQYEQRAAIWRDDGDDDG